MYKVNRSKRVTDILPFYNFLHEDVTHFVKYNSALDREAARRATTFYLVDRRFDMLPSLLSSGESLIF